jgi:hypothetical protein
MMPAIESRFGFVGLSGCVRTAPRTDRTSGSHERLMSALSSTAKIHRGNGHARFVKDLPKLPAGGVHVRSLQA